MDANWTRFVMRPIRTCMNKTLKTICKQAMQIEQVSELVQPLLPDSLQNECQVASFHRGRLKLVCKNPNKATELRYLLPELRDKLRINAKLYNLMSIDVIIQYELNHSKPHVLKSNNMVLSEKTKSHLLQFASECQYQPLQEALYRLIEVNHKAP